MADQSYLLTFLSGATAQLEEPLRHDLMGHVWKHAEAVHTMNYFNRAIACQDVPRCAKLICTLISMH